MATSFTLVIDIRGLCLFAPHGSEMHVLLPDERAGGHRDHPGHRMPTHAASISFDAKYNAPGNRDPGRIKEDFENVRWDLGSVVAGGATLTLPPVVVDVAQFVRPRGLERHQLRRGQQTAVKSHLVLSAGRVECHGKVPHFRIGAHPDVPMTSMLRWVIPGVPGNRLAWEFENLDGTPARTPEPLAPDNNGVIKLDLLHAPEGEIASDVCDPALGNHFPAYYPLFKGSGPMPVCKNVVDAGECSEDEFSLLPSFLAPNVFTCMIGKTALDTES